MSNISVVARILGISELEVRKLCISVQREFKQGEPPFSVILAALVRHPNTTPREFAETISPTLVYVPKAEPPKSEGQGQQQNRESRSARKAMRAHERLVSSLADLLPGKDQGNREAARELLEELEHRCPASKTLNNA
jgi:hypothetical protein